MELNLDCLKTEKAKRLEELDSLVYDLDCTIDSPLFVEKMDLARELLGELDKTNPNFIFAVKEWDYNQVSFICKLATGTSLDGEFGHSNEYNVLHIGLDGYFEHEEFLEMMENFYESKSNKLRRDR
ncbi:hypothetical protein [Aliarcobacter butzleri]|uniref:hypothetical protein n=1 Tax=Aliarcobacter butzleri TaxID=28197 RepID=UPI001EDB5B74|nr:hypothetical protein [Aliarcobacter butzleri]MCG3654659.1 hypothetical protein [Aliarcobacter butzleri]